MLYRHKKTRMKTTAVFSSLVHTFKIFFLRHCCIFQILHSKNLSFFTITFKSHSKWYCYFQNTRQRQPPAGEWGVFCDHSQGTQRPRLGLLREAHAVFTTYPTQGF